MNSTWEVMEGTPGIGEQDVAHLMIPGRYRSPDGMGLHPFSEQRVMAELASRNIDWGLQPDRQNSSDIAKHRADQAWRVVLGLKSLAGSKVT